MAIIHNGMISGKLGDKVYFIKDGKEYVRAYQKGVDANTYKQQVQRAKMRAVMQFLKYFTQPMALGFQHENKKKSAHGEAIRYYLNNALREVSAPGEPPVFEIDMEKSLVAQGFITPPEILSVTRNENYVTLTWNNELGHEYNRYYDQLAAIYYTPGVRAFFSLDVGLREKGQGTFRLEEECTTGPVHVWAFFWNGEKGRKKSRDFVSNSVYLGEV